MPCPIDRAVRYRQYCLHVLYLYAAINNRRATTERRLRHVRTDYDGRVRFDLHRHCSTAVDLY